MKHTQWPKDFTYDHYKAVFRNSLSRKTPSDSIFLFKAIGNLSQNDLKAYVDT